MWNKLMRKKEVSGEECIKNTKCEIDMTCRTENKFENGMNDTTVVV